MIKRTFIFFLLAPFILFAWALPLSAAPPDMPAPRPNEFPSQQLARPQYTYWVTNPTSGAQLFVPVILPNNPGKSPAVVLVPGGINSSRGFLDPPKALRLADAGFVVVLFDPDGRGKSTGKEDFGGYIHQDGLAAVVRFTAGLPYVDAQKIGLVTYSYGITMASGALARYSDLPIRFLIDWEGPANRVYTTSGCKETGGERGKTGWNPCSDSAYWSEREAVNFIGKILVPYQRIQSERDHVQPTNTHAVEMINAAVNGGVPWVRLNYYPPNQKYDPKAPPAMFPEREDRMLEQKIADCAHELLKR
ncbi:MAG: hypothetical protein JXA50_12230 [Deltaproteobacteria bacterium]|nr:hypothetical protein [Deltaproteobacteria bacterium]